jgi:hypothetical protein
MKPQQCLASLALCVVGITAACASNPPPPSGQVGVTSAQSLDDRSAALRLAQAKCKHALACNEIGRSRKFATREACLSENRAKTANDLRIAVCPHGVDGSRLNACVSEVATEACSGLGSGLGRTMSCQTANLCPWR